MTLWNELADVAHTLEFVDAGGVPTRTLRAGPAGGEHVVFLHGTSGHLEAFVRNIGPHAGAGYRCHAIDMLGHGYTGKPDYPYEIPRYAAHLADYLDAVGADRAHLVGESLGGWVAAWLATEQPERVASLQMLCAGGTKADPQVMERLIRTTTEAVTSGDIALTRDRLRLLWAEWDEDLGEELTRVRYDIYHRPEFTKALPNLLALQDMDTRQRNLLRPERLARIGCPALVVWGNKNPFGDVPEATAMAEAIPGARLEILSECGHWPQHEQAGRYNPLSLEFLAGVA